MTSETPGITWLQRLVAHFDRVVWLNPDEPRVWDHSDTARIIGRLFPMHHLSVEGVAEAVSTLVGARVTVVPKTH